MSKTDIPISLHEDPFPKAYQNQFLDVKSADVAAGTRRRSNSQSQVIQQPSTARNDLARLKPPQIKTKERPPKRNLSEYYVTLSTLNDTFEEKHLLVPWYPETIKLGRPTASKTKPDVTNGYFDSRVLSRNHAAMFFDPSLEKIMIQDLGSSNGTFVNDKKISDKPVPIEIGDVINLGFHIQVESNHKQISARVKNINVLANFLKPAATKLKDVSSGPDQNSSFDFKHHDFIQSIFAKLPDDAALPDLDVGVNNTKKVVGNHSKLETGPVKSDPVSFESALFSDINPNLEEALLGLGNRGNTGIFNNSHITNTISLENTISMLTVCLSKVNQQNNTLKSLENFVSNYQIRLEDLNSQYLTKEMEKLSDEYKQKISVQQTSNKKLNKSNEELKNENSAVTQQYDQLKSEYAALQQQLDESKTLQQQWEAENAVLKQQQETRARNGVDPQKLVSNGLLESLSTTSTSTVHATASLSNLSSLSSPSEPLALLQRSLNSNEPNDIYEPLPEEKEEEESDFNFEAANLVEPETSAPETAPAAPETPETPAAQAAQAAPVSSIDDDLAAILPPQVTQERAQHRADVKDQVSAVLTEKKLAYVSLSVVVLGVLYQLYGQ